MNNSMYSNRNSLNSTFCQLSKINPFNSRKTTNGQNMISFKKKFLIPNSTREFGKEINVSSNLTTLPNQNAFKNLKKEKEELNNKLKNYKQIVEIRKKKKELSNSFPHKPASSNGKISMNKSSREQFKKGINKIKIKNQSQKNILGDNNKNNMTLNMTITDDIVMVDENTNPNVVINNDNTVYENKNKNKIKENEVTQVQDNVKVNDNIKDIKKEEDVLMQIETEVKDMKLEDNVIIPKNVNPQNVDEYFDDICEEYSKNEDK